MADAAVRFFGSVAEAMAVAGVEPKRRHWTEQRVIQTIQDRFVQGHPISIAGCGDGHLAGAAKRRFGCWAAAVAAAGLSEKYTKPTTMRSWTKEAVLAGIQKWHAEGRVLSDVSKQDQGLYCAAKKHFGGWRAAVIAAGLEPTRKRWNKAKVIAEIRLRSKRGASLVSTIVFREDPPLAGAGTRLFGNWRKAVAAATKGTTPKTRKGK